MCGKTICIKILAVIFILMALALAVMVSLWHQQGMAYIIFVSRFFDVILPVLGVGALLKYLTCNCCHCHKDGEDISCCKKD